MSNVLDAVTGTLPAKAQPYAKTYAASAIAAVNALVLVADVPDWVSIVLAVVSAPVVFAVPNKDPLAEKQDESVQPPDDGSGLVVDPAQVVIVKDKPLPPPEPSGYASGV